MDLSSAPTERNLLATLVKSRDAWLSVADVLSKEDFAHELNASLYTAICALHERRAVIDPVIVSERLSPERRSELDGLGGWSYIAALQDQPGDPKNAVLYAEELRALSLRRRTENAGANIQTLAREEKDVEKMLAAAQVELDTVQATQDEGVVLIGTGLEAFVQSKIEQPILLPGLKSGFKNLDQSLQGFQSQELYVLGARKKTGKSTLLLNWAKFLAVDNSVPVLWLTTEHGLRLEQTRLLSMAAEVPYLSLMDGSFKEFPARLDRVAEATGRIDKAPLYFKSIPGFTIQKVQRMARKYVRLDGVQVIFFDYIKSPSDYSSNAKEYQVLGELAYGLKALAAEEDVPVISAVQMNREAAAAQRVEMDVDSDFFSGSDRIAQALTVGLALRKPFKEELGAYDSDGSRVLQVVDNRLGPASYKSVIQFEASNLMMKEHARLN